ncbi:MAG: hypothetical protein RMX68_020640 [Aulosira sp. ZfuVER01]|nr:HEPN domain-containing protein [Aulosira sp. ZfuVER01]MDZ8002533.1 HEPN domain-containing protein [Aulosira sp. DedVER01a]MDZ8050789.1 HEPN domain-containing protein [Aulosira sp. ZfuCHP01]
MKDLLKQFVLTIQSVIQSSSINLEVSETIYCRDKILEFNYIDDTPTWQSQNQYITKKNYIPSAEVINLIKDSTYYKLILEETIKDDSKIDSISLDSLIDFFTNFILNNSDFHENQIDLFIEQFLSDINQEPFKCSANIELSGIIIKAAPIEFSINGFKIILREIRIQDLEEDHIIYPYLNLSPVKSSPTCVPSAILNIESYILEKWKLQLEIEKIIAILRLFKVCSARYISYKLDSEAILWQRRIGGTITSLKYLNVVPYKKIKITEQDVANLIYFYRKIVNYIPECLYESNIENKGMVHLAIAYRHYCEAILNNTTLEEKITNAVIGLEALILSENQEIAFRFCIRGAKILSLFNYSAIEVKKKLKAAYNIRSTFVHGDDIELEKEVRKLDQNYQSQDFLIEILDYLRVLIIIIIFLSKQNEFVNSKRGVNNFEKRKFLDIVDDSLIDKQQENKLNNILEEVKYLIDLLMTFNPEKNLRT